MFSEHKKDNRKPLPEELELQSVISLLQIQRDPDSYDSKAENARFKAVIEGLNERIAAKKSGWRYKWGFY